MSDRCACATCSTRDRPSPPSPPENVTTPVERFRAGMGRWTDRDGRSIVGPVSMLELLRPAHDVCLRMPRVENESSEPDEAGPEAPEEDDEVESELLYETLESSREGRVMVRFLRGTYGSSLPVSVRLPVPMSLPVSVRLPDDDKGASTDDVDRRTGLSDSLYKATVDPLLFTLQLL